MQCPYCGGEMVKGFIQSARPFWFTLKMKGILLTKNQGDVQLSTDNFSNPHCEAYICTQCTKVLIDYGQNV